jgi:peptidoglycan/xylan/chitin deacetylase (PgdA/CDA1 family)
MNDSASRVAFRLDRMLTMRLFSPFRPATPRPPRLRVLMYHAISRQLDRRVHPYYRTATSPERFKAQMEFLRGNGYCLMTLGQALQWARGGSERAPTPADPESPDRSGPVVVTFDDGFRDFYTTAFPILQRLGIPSTVFLATGCLDGRFVTGEECLRKSEVAMLAAQGVEFGSHTVTHPKLVELEHLAVEAELLRSREDIQQMLGRAVTLFSYPYRFPEEDVAFTARLAASLEVCGYVGGVTTRIGRSSCTENPFFLKRLPVDDDDDIAFFRAKLEGAYDWLHTAQLAYKCARRLLRHDRKEH